MAEHDSDREKREDRDDREPEEQHVPFDEDAAWAAIVAGYGDEPTDPPGSKPFKSVEDLALLESDTNDGTGDGRDEEPQAGQGDKGAKVKQTDEPKEDTPAKPAKPLGSSISFAPGVGPRDYSVPEPAEEDFDAADEGHFVPPSRRPCLPPTRPRSSPGSR